jgi:uncharacterized protein
MTGLRIAPDFELPLEAVTEAFAILAVSGAGKSNAGVTLAEELYDNDLPWVAIDPKGDWWGVRSSADGKSAGLSVVVFGGEHADVPLEPGAGRYIADLIVEKRLTCVLDISEMTKADQRRFLIDFAERLYKRNREPLMVICEEADEYIPQMVRGDMAKLVGAMETLVKRGRFRGIGTCLITQRSASLNKDVLSQARNLIVLQTTSPQDRKAILDWIRHHAASQGVVDELPQLQPGEAYFFSPAWLRMLTKIRFRRRRTYDSGATPKIGEKRRPPARLADVDLAAIKEAMAETIERAKADDPKELRKRIAELERHRCPEPAAVERERIDVPVLTADDRQLVRDFITRWDEGYDQATEIVNTLTNALARVAAATSGRQPSQTPVTGRSSGRATPSGAPTRPAAPPAATPVADRRPAGDGDPPLGKTSRTVLQVLVQHGACTKRRLAILSGYSAKASTIRVALGELRRLGYVEPDQPIRATQAGVDAAGGYDPLPTGQALLDHWRNELDGTSRNVLDAMLSRYPDESTKHDIAEITGYSPDASTIRVALGKLRGLELVEGSTISADFARSVGLA